MDRDRLLEEVLGRLSDGTAAAAAQSCREAWDRDADPAALGLASVAAFWLGDFAQATSWAESGHAEASDDEARGICLAAAALAAGGDVAVRDTARWTEALDLASSAPDGSRWWAFVRYLVAESALVGARLDDAALADSRWSPPADLWAGHPFAVMMRVCSVRTAAFAGRIDDATALLDAARADLVVGTRLALALDAVTALVRGNAGDLAAVARSRAVADHVPVVGRDFVDRGIMLLLAFGAIAIGDVPAAAEHTLRAGGDEMLSRCTVIDRALGLEMLLVAALDDDDPDAAAAWLSALELLVDHPVSRPTVRRAVARAALARGDVDLAVDLLTSSIAECSACGRRTEAAEGEIVLARARIARHDLGGASRALRALVADSDRHGHGAVRRSAGTTLGGSGRRLPPVAGAGWEVLSAREAEVARAILAGKEVDQIAAELFLSPRTVRVHTSRVLCAFGVATRVGLLAQVGHVDGTEPEPRPPLSPRQGEVAALVAKGLTNRQIADELGISVKGVEKHVGDVLLRWSAGSRFELARIWWAGAGRAPDPAG